MSWQCRLMRFLWMLLPLLACNTPSFEFSGVPAQRVIVSKSVFDVRMVGDRAEEIRINREWAPSLNYTAARFARAFEAASGCKLRPYSMQGDQVVMQARLKCDIPRRSNPLPQRRSLDCSIFETTLGVMICDEIYPVAVPGG